MPAQEEAKSEATTEPEARLFSSPAAAPARAPDYAPSEFPKLCGTCDAVASAAPVMNDEHLSRSRIVRVQTLQNYTHLS